MPLPSRPGPWSLRPRWCTTVSALSCSGAAYAAAASARRAMIRQGIEALQNTGYQELTLLSLSTSDYRELPGLCDGLLAYCEERSIGLSLPSLRADNFSMELMQKLQKVREGGSQRLRAVINKNVTEEDLLNTCAIAFSGGWNNVKLYYMLGLPTETDEDILGIAAMANAVLHCWRTHAKNKNRGVRITVSTSCFIPKPHSPFQWEAQISLDEYRRRVELLRGAITAKNVVYNWHDAETSFIEAVLSKGDRRVADAVEWVFRNGGRLDAWTASSTAASTRISMPTARSRRMHSSPGITSMSVCAGSTFCASGNAPVGPSFPRTAAVSAPPAVPPAC